ncbi:MMPL family transporter, partial [Vibrio sinaloensis]
MNTEQPIPKQPPYWLTMPTRFSWWMLLATMLLVVVATIGGKNLYFRGDYNIFFDGQNAQLRAYDEIQTTFAKSDNLSIVIAPKSGEVFEGETLSLVQQLTKDAWQIPYSSRVDSLANYQHTEALEDDLIVEDLLLEEYELTDARIDKIKRIALSEPVVKHSLISGKGDVTVVNITVQLPQIDETAEAIEVIDSANALIEKYQQQYPNVEFYKAGIVAMNHAFMVAAQDDSATLVPTMLLVILLFLTIMLRSFLSVIATLVVIIASVMATMGLSGWAGMFLSTATVNIPTLVMTLAVADCVHVIA